ncbi:MAG: hypothetical protein IGS49_29390 [Chlorogloeopsis fritschii C42_A2020_084]|uniref:WD40/YVTN/BNR-like repeat-containing protein n=1 Tax=Chlorogloeopsis fritschii TaxID=1124 RepID=UPI0019F5FB57|nr:hypothetical protein [Chlorogloeopsis fritschii]MBF2009430.1 hypothetical protein [Chlorogloeopsis fritschii C42_A2020_084]
MVEVAQQNVKQATLDSSNSESQSRKLSVLAGTSKGLWVLESEQRIELEGFDITAIAPSNDGLWAIANHNSVWQRNLNGEWRKVASSENLRLHCLLPVDDTVLVGTSEAHLMRVVEGNMQIIDSFEQAEGRDEWYTPWGGLPDVRSLAQGTSGELYTNIHVGGILRSRDRGKSWQPTLDIHADVHEVRTVADRPGLVLAATAQGLAISQDGGDDWSFDRKNLHAIYARAINLSGDTILMSVSMGPSGSKAALYRRSLDQMGTFEKCEQGLPEWFSDNINTGCIATSGNIAGFATRDGQIFLSNDAGLTWEGIASGLGLINCLTLI